MSVMQFSLSCSGIVAGGSHGQSGCLQDIFQEWVSRFLERELHLSSSPPCATLWDHASSVSTLCECFLLFFSVDVSVSSLSISIECVRSPTLSAEDVEWAFCLTRANMKDEYVSCCSFVCHCTC